MLPSPGSGNLRGDTTYQEADPLILKFPTCQQLLILTENIKKSLINQILSCTCLAYSTFSSKKQYKKSSFKNKKERQCTSQFKESSLPRPR
jgi:hypothetical protein